jgi:hypothetical protein
MAPSIWLTPPVAVSLPMSGLFCACAAPAASPAAATTARGHLQLVICIAVPPSSFVFYWLAQTSPSRGVRRPGHFGFNYFAVFLKNYCCIS